MDQEDKKKKSLKFLPVIIGAILGGPLAFFFFKQCQQKPGESPKAAGMVSPEKSEKTPATPEGNLTNTTTSTLPDTTAQTPKKPKLPETQVEMLASISDALQTADFEKLKALLSEDALKSVDLEKLQKMQKEGILVFSKENSVTEVGEVERNKRVRWALNLENKSRILIDLAKDEKEAWRIAKLQLPEFLNGKWNGEGEGNSSLEITDALGVTDSFLRAAISQQFEQARLRVDQEKIHDATIAGICILFEEGSYKLRDQKPVRSMFSRPKTDTNPAVSGFLANVESQNGAEAGNIGMTVKQNPENRWVITDISLDNLLGDFAQRYSEGDRLYTPIVKNPKGGDSIALYFGFDDATLSQRSTNQLQIIANLLKIDSEKKIEISGHADSVGTEEYNLKLSEKRAIAVKETLVRFGLLPEQVITKSFGKTQPRRPVVSTAGREEDRVRRVNRRAEIYLDF